MKLSGGKRNGQHLGKSNGRESEPDSPGTTRSSSGRHVKKRARSGKKKFLRFLTILFVLIIMIMSVVYAYYKIAVKPPPVKGDTRPPRQGTHPPNESADPTAPPAELVSPEDRPPLVYTFLVLGTDDGNWNTDTLMAVRFDATTYKLNVVNIPRDTTVNVSWNTKKINSILSNELAYFNKDKNLSSKERKDKALSATVDKFTDILGFEVDYYVLVDMKAFEAMINAVGGVDYNLPKSMNYDDPAQNLSIHFKAGSNHFNGADALKVMRFRSSYASGDIGRIEFQQDFLMSAAKQILEKKSSLSITSLADIFLNYMVTDLELNDVIWLGLELLKLDSENITFDKLPGNYNDSVGGNSYVTIHVDEWLTLVNDKLNPYPSPIERDDVSILYRGSDGKIHVTDGNYAYSNTSWGAKSSSSSGSPSSGSSGTSSGSSGNSNSSSGTESPKPSESPPVESPADVTPPGNTSEPAGDPDNYPSQLGPPPDSGGTPDTGAPEPSVSEIGGTVGEFE